MDELRDVIGDGVGTLLGTLASAYDGYATKCRTRDIDTAVGALALESMAVGFELAAECARDVAAAVSEGRAVELPEMPRLRLVGRR